MGVDQGIEVKAHKCSFPHDRKFPAIWVPEKILKEQGWSEATHLIISISDISKDVLPARLYPLFQDSEICYISEIISKTFMKDDIKIFLKYYHSELISPANEVHLSVSSKESTILLQKSSHILGTIFKGVSIVKGLSLPILEGLSGIVEEVLGEIKVKESIQIHEITPETSFKIVFANEISKEKKQNSNNQEICTLISNRNACVDNICKEIGGVRENVCCIVNIITLLINSPKKDAQVLQPLNGMILHGPTGVGKSQLARSILQNSGLNDDACLWLSGSTVFRKNLGESENFLRDFYKKASLNSPSIVVIDEIENICSTSNRSMVNVSIGAQLSEILDKIHENGDSVFTIGITSDISVIDPSIFKPGRLEFRQEIGIPGFTKRYEMLKIMLRKIPFKIDQEAVFDNDSTEYDSHLESFFTVLAKRCHGYVAADLKRLCTEAAFLALKRGKANMTNSNEINSRFVFSSDFFKVMESFRPMLVSSNSFFATAQLPSTSFSELAGIDDEIAELVSTILLPLKQPEMLASMGLNTSGCSGVLVHGPPGTGKTTLVRALATAAKDYANFIPIECPEIVNKIVGQSEKTISEIFRAARQISPCILFFDQIETLACKRGFSSSSQQSFDRILSSLLVELDGLTTSSRTEDGKEDKLIVIGVTNNIGWLDPAIIRPGRLEHHIDISVPNFEKRCKIFEKHTEKLPIHGSVDIDELVKRLASQLDGISGAVVRNICQEAAMLSLRENIENDAIYEHHFENALKLVISSNKIK